MHGLQTLSWTLDDFLLSSDDAPQWDSLMLKHPFAFQNLNGYAFVLRYFDPPLTRACGQIWAILRCIHCRDVDIALELYVHSSAPYRYRSGASSSPVPETISEFTPALC